MKNKKMIGIGVIILILAIVLSWYLFIRDTDVRTSNSPSDFRSCVEAGNPIMESYPEQCSAEGKTFSNPDQKAPALPGSSEAMTEKQAPDIAVAADDDVDIRATLISYCTANGATDPTIIEKILTDNQADPSLYIKSGTFARLSASCGEGGFRAFLRKTSDGSGWKFIAGTQMETIGCAALDGIGVPAVIATQCYDEDGELRSIKS